MQAIVLHDIAAIESSPLRLEERPLPEPGRGEVRIKVSCCAICRTDLHVIEGDLPQATLPIVPGHQVVGVIDKVGEGSTLSEGQRIGVAWLRHTCGECVFCNHEQENLCESSRYTGYHVDGGYAEYAVVPEAYAYPIPEGFGDYEAAPLLCGGIIGYRALRRANVPDGGSLTLFGFGSSAHIVLQIARHRGCDVHVVTRGQERIELAREMGAVWAGADATDMPCKTDSAIVFAPNGDLVPVALQAVRKGGTVSLAGIHMSPIPEMEYETTLFYERDLHSVTANTREDGRELLAEAAAANVRPHVTTYPLSEANRALQDLKAGRISGTGVLRCDE